MLFFFYCPLVALVSFCGVWPKITRATQTSQKSLFLKFVFKYHSHIFILPKTTAEDGVCVCVCKDSSSSHKQSLLIGYRTLIVGSKFGLTLKTPTAWGHFLLWWWADIKYFNCKHWGHRGPVQVPRLGLRTDIGHTWLRTMWDTSKSAWQWRGGGHELH